MQLRGRRWARAPQRYCGQSLGMWGRSPCIHRSSENRSRAPSYSQPLLNTSPKKPRIFSQWITIEHPRRRGNGGCFSADSSGKLPCSRERSWEAQHHHPSKRERGVGLALLLAVAKLSRMGHSDTLQNGKLEATHYSAEPLQGQTEPHPRGPLL